VLAGKAHPRDERGQEILRDVFRWSRSKALLGKVFVVEDYDLEWGRRLVQGVDLWLNTPVRMLEASGTSGMKAAANGTLNLSIGDGWWPEAARDGANGWLLEPQEVGGDAADQDRLDGQRLYELLETEIVPAFFDREADGLPQRWIAMALRALRTIPREFNSDRMVAEYHELAYRPLSVAWFGARHPAGVPGE
jgi:starch phosphorylase